MTTEDIRHRIKEIGEEPWYYYYDFAGVEVQPKLKNDKTCGLLNWNKKLKPIIQKFTQEFHTPKLLDIGCNMALYAHEMTKMGIDVLAVDRQVVTSQFFQEYVQSYLKEPWNVQVLQMDVTKDNLPEFAPDVITMFCVLYHLHPLECDVIKRIQVAYPNHKYLIIQGNIPRVKKKKQPLAGVKGMKKFLTNLNYEIVEVYEWDGYQKPVVVAKYKE